MSRPTGQLVLTAVITAATLLATLPAAHAQQQQYQRQQAEARERMPHPGSASHTGTFTPVSNLLPLISGKTLVLEHPVVANQQVIGTAIEPLYFAPDGRSYSTSMSGTTWSVRGNQICFNGNDPRNCSQVLRDSENQLFLLSSGNVLVHFMSIEVGDPTHTQANALSKTQNRQAGTQGPSAFLNALQGYLTNEVKQKGMLEVIKEFESCTKRKPITLGGQTAYVSDCD